MSKITSVGLTDRRVEVKLACWGRPDLFRVVAEKSLRDEGKMEDVQVTWMGTHNRWIPEAEEFHEALGEALRVAKSMQKLLDRRDSPRGDGMDMEYDLPQFADYLTALYVLVHGGEVFYLRDQHGKWGATATSPRVVEREGLDREAMRIFRETHPEKASV